MESNEIFRRVECWPEEPEPNQEKEKQLEVLNLFELNEEQKEKLRSAVEAADGRIILTVHPFFRENDTRVRPAVVPLEQYEKAKSRPARLKSKELLPPFIILEEQKSLHSLEKRLISFLGQAATGEFYVVPTYPGNPEPNYFLLSNFCLSNPKNWQKLIDTLKDVGVKKIFLTGMFLFPDLQGCVGMVARKLANCFQEIKISSLFTMPSTGGDIKKRRRKSNMKLLPPYDLE